MRLSRRDTSVALGHRLLHLDRAAHRINDAGKLHEHAVAGGLDDAAVVLGDFRIEELAAQRLEAFERALLIRPISREYPATSAARIAARRRVWLMSPVPRPGAARPAGVRGFLQ
jgi:hypothetical protein